MSENELDQLLSKYPANVRDIALQAGQTVMAWIPDMQEMVDSPRKVIGYGFGPGYKDLICTLILSKTEVKLGVVNSADSPDPNGLLEGTGKRHRYVTLAKPSDLKKPGVKGLLKARVAEWQQRSKGR